MPKIFDCINYNGEEEMLDIRLNVLDPVVDKFIISECTKTFTQLIKPLFFLEQKNRFKKFLHKIIYHQMEPLSFPIIPGLHRAIDSHIWANERYQRNSIWLILNEIAKEEDFILYSGVDEIPRPQKLMENKNIDETVFMMKPCYYWINCISKEADFHGTLLIQKRTLNNFYFDCPYYKEDEEEFNKTGNKPNGGIYWTFENFGLEAARVNKPSYKNKVQNGGWHYQWYGGTTEIIKKLLSWSHAEAHDRGLSNQERLEKQMRKMQGIDPKKDLQLRRIDLDETAAPKYILDNPERFNILK